MTYVGKDIAYQLWKFGLLGRDFGYRFWKDEGVWETALEGAERPSRRSAARERVINVIDARQSYLQKIVRAGLEALGHTAEARALGPLRLRDGGALARRRAACSAIASEGDGEEQGARDVGPQGHRRQGRRPARPARARRAARRSPSATAISAAPSSTPWRDRSPSPRCASSWSRRPRPGCIAFDFDEALNFEGESRPLSAVLRWCGRKTSCASCAPAGLAADVSAERQRAALPRGAVERRPLGPGPGRGPDPARWSRRRRRRSSCRSSPATRSSWRSASTPSTTSTRSSRKRTRRYGRPGWPRPKSSCAGSGLGGSARDSDTREDVGRAGPQPGTFPTDRRLTQSEGE